MVADKVPDGGYSISIEKGREFQENIYFCFIDYAKVGWHHRLNGHKFEQTPGDSEGQESLAGCHPQGLKQLDVTERLNKEQQISSAWIPEEET